MQRLQKKYKEEVMSKLMDEYSVANIMAVPKVTKVIVNIGIGDASKNKEMMDQMKRDVAAITGQAPSVRLARISVASFGLRRGMPVGLKVTLRGEKMYAFLDRLFSIVLPRLRDFRGVPATSFDGKSSYNLGMAEHTVFPEIDVTKSRAKGLEITINTNAKNVDEARSLLTGLGMPFEKGGADGNVQKAKK